MSTEEDANDMFLDTLGWEVDVGPEGFSLYYAGTADAYGNNVRLMNQLTIHLPYHILKEYRRSKGVGEKEMNNAIDKPWLDAINEIALELAIKMDNVQRDLRRKLGLPPDPEILPVPVVPVGGVSLPLAQAWGNISLSHDGEEEEPKPPQKKRRMPRLPMSSS